MHHAIKLVQTYCRIAWKQMITQEALMSIQNTMIIACGYLIAVWLNAMVADLGLANQIIDSFE